MRWRFWRKREPMHVPGHYRLVVVGARTQAEADYALQRVLTGSFCTWPDKPSRWLVDAVVPVAIAEGILRVERA